MPEKKEPLELKYLTYAQKRVLKELDDYKVPWTIKQVHSNGDVSIFEEDSQQIFRINEKGTVVDQGKASLSSKVNIPKTKQPEMSFGSPEPESWYRQVKPDKPVKKETVKKEPAHKEWSYGNSVCRQKPECCKPRDIKAVFFDADHTAWLLSGGIASSVTGKLCKIDNDTVVELKENNATCPVIAPTDDISKIESEIVSGLSEHEISALGVVLPASSGPPPKEGNYRTVIKLLPTFRQTLDELNKRKIPVSIISLNTPGTVKRIFDALGLADKFYEIRDSYINKGTVFAELTHKMNICGCEGMFVDDRADHGVDVAKEGGLALQIGPGKDIEKPIQILDYIKA